MQATCMFFSLSFVQLNAEHSFAFLVGKTVCHFWTILHKYGCNFLMGRASVKLPGLSEEKTRVSLAHKTCHVSRLQWIAMIPCWPRCRHRPRRVPRKQGPLASANSALTSLGLGSCDWLVVVSSWLPSLAGTPKRVRSPYKPITITSFISRGSSEEDQMLVFSKLGSDYTLFPQSTFCPASREKLWF